jgi:hypothetical protein
MNNSIKLVLAELQEMPEGEEVFKKFSFYTGVEKIAAILKLEDYGYETTVADLLVDIIRYCDCHNINFKEEVADALEDAEAELSHG